MEKETTYQQGIIAHADFMAGNHDGLNPYSTNDVRFKEWELGWLRGVNIAFAEIFKEEMKVSEQKTLDFPK